MFRTQWVTSLFFVSGVFRYDIQRFSTLPSFKDRLWKSSQKDGILISANPTPFCSLWGVNLLLLDPRRSCRL